LIATNFKFAGSVDSVPSAQARRSMGARLGGAPRPVAQEQARGVFIDSNGNLCKPAGNPMGTELLSASRRDIEVGNSNSRFQTLSNITPMHGQQHPASPVQVLKERWQAFRGRSVYSALIAVQVVMYAISLWVVTPRRVMMPDFQTNWKLGSPDRFMEQCSFAVGGKFVFELRRFFVPMFLHWNPLHIIFNIGFQVSYGVEVHNLYGPSAYLCMFLVCGCCGVTLTESFERSGVGASTSCYGLLAAYAAQIWMVWNQNQDETWRWFHKMMILSTCIGLVTWELIGWSRLDHFGHLGGLLSGFPLGVLLFQGQTMPANAVTRRRICAALLAVGITACILKIFLTGSDDFLHNSNGTRYTWQERCEEEWQRGYSQV